MRARRDTYHDYVTAQEFAEAGKLTGGMALLAKRKVALFARSGAAQVSNATYQTFGVEDADAMAMRVYFNSRAWTGAQ